MHAVMLVLVNKAVTLAANIDIYVKKLHSLNELCKGDFVVGDIKLQRSPLQNSNFVCSSLHILSVGFVLTVCNGEVGIL